MIDVGSDRAVPLGAAQATGCAVSWTKNPFASAELTGAYAASFPIRRAHDGDGRHSRSRCFHPRRTSSLGDTGPSEQRNRDATHNPGSKQMHTLSSTTNAYANTVSTWAALARRASVGRGVAGDRSPPSEVHDALRRFGPARGRCAPPPV